jgi:hypothetical protein
MTTDEAIQKLHDTHGDFLAEISVENYDGHLNVNVALSKIPTDEAIHLISFNAPTLGQAIIKAALA